MLNSSYFYELCHDCRRFWKDRGIRERDAVARTKAYRAFNDFYGPVSPDLIVGQEEMRRFETQVGDGGWAEISLEEQLPKRGNGKEVNRTLHPNHPNESSVTLWPTFADTRALTHPEMLPEAPPRAYLPARTSNSKRSGPDSAMVGMESEHSPGYFELRNMDQPLPLRLNKDGCKRQNTRATRPDLDKSLQSLQSGPDDLAMGNFDNPLLRPPRRDPEMAGRWFDSEHPKRDGWRRSYFPRIF